MEGPTLWGLAIAFAILFVAFRALELFRPRSRRLPVLRKGLLTDGAYWLFTPFVTKAITRVCVAGVAIPFALIAYGKFDRELILQGFGPLSRLPLWVQAVALLAIGDFVGYWMHRAFHGRRLWRFHAVHHSSVELDWLGRAGSSRQRRRHAGCGNAAGACARFRAGRGRRNRTGADDHGDFRARQSRLGLGAVPRGDRLAALSSLAPHR
jgi:hypothetical protein